MARKSKSKGKGKDKAPKKKKAKELEQVVEPTKDAAHSELTGESWAEETRPEPVLEPEAKAEEMAAPEVIAAPEPEPEPKAPAAPPPVPASPTMPVGEQLVVIGTVQSQPAAAVVSSPFRGARRAVVIWRQPNGKIEEMGRRHLKRMSTDDCLVLAKQMLTGVKEVRWQEQAELREIAKEL